VSHIDDRGGSCPTGLNTECRELNSTLSVVPPRVDPLTIPDSQAESSVKLYSSQSFLGSY
jgi:hypothetical protein